jgi:thiol-disulfide isomerase/thioredoxin
MKLPPLALFVCATLAAACLARASETVPTSAGVAAPARPASLVGQPAPDFTVVGPKGESLKLSSLLGKIVIVDVSATWCGPCQAAMPNNDRVFKKYADQGVVLLGITADDTRAAYDGWVERNASKYGFTMYFDTVGRDGWKDSVFNTAYHVSGFPTMFVVGRDGKVTEMLSGGGPGEDYRLEYALARAGAKVDLKAIPAEPAKDPNAPKSIPAMGKTLAMPAKSVGMIGMGGGMAAATPGSSKFGSVEAWAKMPDFKANIFDGKTVKLSDFKGKVVIVTFFSNYERGPETYATALAAKYAGQEVALLAVASAMEKEKFDAWVASAKPAYTAVWDPAGKAWGESLVNVNFGVGMFPAYAVVNKEGNLVGGYIGMGDKNKDRLAAMLLSAGVPVEKDDLPKVMMAAATIQPKGAAAGGMTAAARIPTLAAGATAPDFTSYSLDGKPVKLSDFKGKIVILDFWATWCGPCMMSLPHTQNVAAKYKDQGVVVLAACTSDTQAKFEEWTKKNQSKYPDLMFTTDKNERGSATFEERASAKLYHVQGIPTQFVIGRDGVIAATIVGFDKGEARSEAALAKLGVKVDPAIVAEGEKQLKAAAEEELKSAAAAKAADTNPRAPFFEDYGKIKNGEVVPDFSFQTAEGKTARFSDYAKGKTVIFDFWATWCGPCQQAMPYYEQISKKYQDQGVVVLGLCCYDTREAYDKWLQTNKDKYHFATVFDPAGRIKQPSREEMDKLSAEEKAAEKARAKKYYAEVLPSAVFAAMPMLPTTLVINKDGKLVGAYSGYNPANHDGLSNLLLRAGIKLLPEDAPSKIWTKTETKPEVKIESLKIGATAPDFVSTDLNGKQVKVSDFKGKVLVLDFWATWCGPCINSMPHTQEVAAKYKDQGVVVLGSCTSDTRDKFESWVKANQEKYPDFIFAHDAAERKPERASRLLYGVQGIPTQFIIGRDGKVADVVRGYLKGEAILDAALAKAGVKVDAALVLKGAEDLKKRNEM